ncbi:MAG: hypothetical protein ACTH2Q_17155 [Propionibacteriaceae bacterium]
MTTIDLHTDHAGRPALRLVFPGWERLMVSRGEYAIPYEANTDVRTEEDWTSEVLGFRSGMVVSGFLKLARFTHPNGTRRLVAMRRGLPLLRIRLRGQEFDEVLVSTPDADTLRSQLMEFARPGAA